MVGPRVRPLPMQDLVWSAAFETGIASVDTQHQGLVERLNALCAYLDADGADPLDVTRLFDEVIADTVAHFREEEQLMEDRGLDPRAFAEHRLAHERFREELDDLRSCLTDGGPELAKLLHSYLTHWLASHILGTDKSMAAQLEAIEMGMVADAVYEAEEHAILEGDDPMLVALNGMYEHVAELNRELIRMNRSLESTVAERTRELREANEHLAALSLTDALTGLPNRRHGLRVMQDHWEAGWPLACIMIDVDHFKEVNDTYGHDAGDAVLVHLGRALTHAVHTDDLVVRLGGDEFCVVCPGTSEADALLLAERMRRQVAVLEVSIGEGRWLGSISVGVAVRGPGMAASEDLLKRADEGVYAAKQAGRNRVRTGGQRARARAATGRVSASRSRSQASTRTVSPIRSTRSRPRSPR